MKMEVDYCCFNYTIQGIKCWFRKYENLGENTVIYNALLHWSNCTIRQSISTTSDWPKCWDKLKRPKKKFLNQSFQLVMSLLKKANVAKKFSNRQLMCSRLVEQLGCRKYILFIQKIIRTGNVNSICVIIFYFNSEIEK